MFAIVFRYMKTDYAKSMMIIGAIGMALNVLFIPIPPVSKKQIGGR
jgi:MFS transporter, NNP family, nitrate/nitrite transporter